MELLAGSLTVSSVLPWVYPLALLFGAWVFIRGGGGTAIQSLQAANNVLKDEIQKLRDDLKSAQTTITELKAQKDVVVALNPLIQWTIDHEKLDVNRHSEALTAFTTLADHLIAHEKRAEARLDRLLQVLNLIAGRLGPELAER